MAVTYTYKNGVLVGTAQAQAQAGERVPVRTPALRIPPGGTSGCGSPPQIQVARPPVPTPSALHTLAHPRRGGRPLKWIYAVTTIPERTSTLLPSTLKSLAAAGFDKPLLCVDGCTFEQAAEYEKRFGLHVEMNRERRKVNGAWILALWRLWLASPAAERFAVFQDDFLCVKGLREYLDATTTQEKVYWNCYTQRWNDKVVQGKPVGWHEGATQQGQVYHGKQQQKGAGAVALVFTRDAVIELLASEHMVMKPAGAGERGRQLIDGGIVETLNMAGYREVCHQPSLTYHTGTLSTIGHSGAAAAKTFPGEEFDARTLLQYPSEGSPVTAQTPTPQPQPAHPRRPNALADALKAAGVDTAEATAWVNSTPDEPARRARLQALTGWAFACAAGRTQATREGYEGAKKEGAGEGCRPPLDKEGAAARRQPPVRQQPTRPQPRPPGGPGTELTAIFAALKMPGCKQCRDMAAKMDGWGPAGCREHLDEIVADIRGRQSKINLLGYFRAGVHALASGLAFQVNPADPVPGLVGIAIERAEEKARKKAEEQAERSQEGGGSDSSP